MTSRRTVSRIARILALIPYVLDRTTVDVQEIKERFQISADPAAIYTKTMGQAKVLLESMQPPNPFSLAPSSIVCAAIP